MPANLVVQEPLLVKHLDNEITEFIDDKITLCFEMIKREFEKKGYELVFKSEADFNVELMPNKVIVDIERKVDYEKSGTKRTITEFNAVSINPIYDIAKVVERTVEEEARLCNAETDKISRANTWVDIDLVKSGDDEIYSVADTKTDKMWRFAIRGCNLAVPS